MAGSVYLVITTKYLKNELKVVFFGLYTAGYQLSASIGVFAAGALSSIAWQYLFLIPAVTILFLPTLLKSLPGRQGSGDKVDWIGFTIFGLASAFLTLFFSYMAWWMLIVAVALFAVFAVYIAKASDPFVTPAFFKNTRWLAAMSLILVFYFTNYCISPLFNGIGTTVYGMTTAQVSTYVVWAFVCAAIVGTCSGLIIGRIGKQAALIIAACLMIAGFVSAALAVNAGFLALTIAACVFYCGVGLMYSPVVSTVLSTIPQEESGRSSCSARRSTHRTDAMTLPLAIEGSGFTARTCDEVAYFHNALFLIDDQGIITSVLQPDAERYAVERDEARRLGVYRRIPDGEQEPPADIFQKILNLAVPENIRAVWVQGRQVVAK